MKEVDSLLQVAMGYYSAEKFKEGLPVVLDAAARSKKDLSSSNPKYSKMIHTAGVFSFRMGEYNQAKSYWLEAKDIRERIFGKESPEYARSLNNLAAIYFETGEVEKSKLLYTESKDIRAKTSGKGSVDYAESVSNLASASKRLGENANAQFLYLEALDIYGKAKGTESPEYANCLLSLGNCYKQIGEVAKAESAYLKAKEVFVKTGGTENLNYSNVLYALGTLYEENGYFEKAEQMLLECLKIRKIKLGAEHPDCLGTLTTLANLYWNIGNTAQADSLCSKVIEISKQNNMEIIAGESFGNLGAFQLERGDLIKAKQNTLNSLEILASVYGKEHPTYIYFAQNLGLIFSEQGEFAKADTILRNALNFLETSVGKEHRWYAHVLYSVAMNYRRARQFEVSAEYFLYLNNSIQELIKNAAQSSSEKEMSSNLQTFVIQTDNLFSFAQENSFPEVVAATYDNTLFQKGFLQNTLIQVRNRAYSDTIALRKYQALADINRRLIAEYSKPIVERMDITLLEEQSNALEKDLTKTVTGYAEAMDQVKWQEVQADLKIGEAAIEFVHYRFYNPTRLTDSTMYAALVLRPLSAPARQGLAGGDGALKEGNAAAPQFIPLFEKNQLKDLMRGASGGSNFLKINALYSQKPLYDLIWKPLESLLSGVSTVYCASSGLLHRINLAAIATPEGKSYGDRRQLVVLGSTRSLAVGTKASQLAVGNGSQTSSNDAYLAGGIRYDSDSTVIAYANRGATSRSMERNTLAFQPDSLSITRGGVLDYLPATAAEVQEIGQTLRSASLETKVDTGFYATEESFRQLGVGKPSPRIIHVATHGYFFPDPAVSKKHLAIGSEPVFKMSEHPMIRSGLIMAGAKQAWLTGKHPEGSGRRHPHCLRDQPDESLWY